MTLTLPGPFVSAAWLHTHLADPQLVVLDASWYLPAAQRDPHAEYLAGHLPGAQRFDLDAAGETTAPLPHTLPSEGQFGELLQRLGITPAHAVVIYDGSGANLSAGRVWWMCRVFGHAAVAVLDGGIGAWRRAGLPLAAGEEHREPAAVRYPAVRHDALVKTADAVEVWLATQGQVADARPAGRFTGELAEPRAGLRAGHMPGARSLPFNSVVDADGMLLPPELLRAAFASAGLDVTQPIVCSCGSGTSAGALLLALATLGRLDTPIYDGSWSEWGADAARPVATGPA
jgi:thiosulfate/3-mercaptopyruvate sulfurtransferase